MPTRKHLLVTNEIYHVYNKSVGVEEIFVNERNINFALDSLGYYRFPQKIKLSKFKTMNYEAKKGYEDLFRKGKPLVEIYAYSLMPNHYHLLVRQNSEGGIRSFISNFQNSFAKFFNIKNDRGGALFLSSFKAKRIDGDDIFKHVSRYIHLNPVTSRLMTPEDVVNCSWNSLGIYTNNIENSMVNKSFLLKIFGSSDKYAKFVLNQVNYQRHLRDIKSHVFD